MKINFTKEVELGLTADELISVQPMGLPPTLPPKDMTEEEKLPLGTLVFVKNDINRFWKKGFYIVSGYSKWGHYGSGANWGYKEVHEFYCQENMQTTSIDFGGEDSKIEYEIIK